MRSIYSLSREGLAGQTPRRIGMRARDKSLGGAEFTLRKRFRNSANSP